MCPIFRLSIKQFYKTSKILKRLIHLGVKIFEISEASLRGSTTDITLMDTLT